MSSPVYVLRASPGPVRVVSKMGQPAVKVVSQVRVPVKVMRQTPAPVKVVNKVSIRGIESLDVTRVVEMTETEYAALPLKDPTTLYIIVA